MSSEPGAGSAGTGLRLARLARGFSQQQLAGMAGISRQAVSAVESGLSDPSLRVALASHTGRPAIRYKGRSVTYGELDARARRWAAQLQQLGVARVSLGSSTLPLACRRESPHPTTSRQMFGWAASCAC